MSDKKGVVTVGKENAREAIRKKEEDIKTLKAEHVTQTKNLKNKQAEDLQILYNELSELRKTHRGYRSILDPRRWFGLGGKSRRNSRRGKKSNRTRKSNRK